jgi:hypothetical protein
MSTVTHGKSGTALYQAWGAMISRCHSPTNAHYKDYGARGIAVCAEWRGSFGDFEFYVAQLPHFEEEGYTLDRINNDGNYEPGNVRWATDLQQHRNTRGNRMITHDGRTLCLLDWAREAGLTQQSLGARLKRGMSMKEAIETPRQSGIDHIVSYGGKEQCLKAWAKEVGIQRLTLYYRLSNGWDVERALFTPVRDRPRTVDAAPTDEPLYPQTRR